MGDIQSVQSHKFQGHRWELDLRSQWRSNQQSFWRAYQRPLLVGYSSGATLVYAALAAAPPEAFAGAISLGFCPDLEIHKPLCHGRALASRELVTIADDPAHHRSGRA